MLLCMKAMPNRATLLASAAHPRQSISFADTATPLNAIESGGAL